jgi:hypothetical protein
MKSFRAFHRIPVTGAGLSAVGEPFMTDENGRPDPNPQIQREAQDYNHIYGLPAVNHNFWLTVNQERAGRIADAYDALPLLDTSVVVSTAYRALATECAQQWRHAVAHGMTFEPWTGSGDAYTGPDGYATAYGPDADIFHRHMFYFTGGSPNVFMAARDPQTGVSYNEMFRCIHDYFGHAAMGADFGPNGEETAWACHMQMFTAAAQAALTTETRGQNSWVNFGRQNYDVAGRYQNILPSARPYAPQKTAVFQGSDAWIVQLPPEVRG